MKKQKLIIGIDLTNEYCQACYYSFKHQRAESVTTGQALARYTFPAALSYSEEKESWVIGRDGDNAFSDLLSGTLSGREAEIGGKLYGFDTLLALYIGKLIEIIQIRSGLMGIESITVSLKSVDLHVKKVLGKVFESLGIESSRVRLLNNAECFAYYILNEDEKLWSDGALLFDFGREGFFVKELSLAGTRREPLFYINERSFSLDFSMKDLGSELLRQELDGKLLNIYRETAAKGARSSVYFTGEGFSEYWFSRTLEEISKTRRAFKGNNIYVKGACLSGLVRHENEGRDYPIICQGRTRASISAVCGRNREETELSGAARDWYEASGEAVFTLGGEKTAQIAVTSLARGEKTYFDFDLSAFPDRPAGTTRVLVSVQYINENECEIRMEDIGFGAFFAPSGASCEKRLDLKGFI